MLTRARITILVLLLAPLGLLAQSRGPVSYRLSFPEPEHRWMQVDVTFNDVPPGALELHMSRSSPGRYALHQFAKNIYDLEATDLAGRPLDLARLNPDQWTVSGHAGTVRLRYRVFGDRIDGTYLGIDSTHAHINMPAAMMWARGLELRPVVVRFEPPTNSKWRVATQLLPGADSHTFTAPNLQFLMDSPAEVSDFILRTFRVPGFTPTFRIVLHHTGSGQEADAFAADVERIVTEERHVFGEYPAFDDDTYTFIADYLPWASRDGMEHRNSTILTSTTTLRNSRVDLLSTVAHEFFHAWNVERIRPQSLEPFNLDDVNMSGELWLAEGFTQYYGELVMARTGLSDRREFAASMGAAIDAVTVSPGRAIHTAEEMSQLAPFWDAATSIDRTNFPNTFISYYTHGEAIALGLDLALRDRSDGTTTLDHYMRALWQKFGKPGGRLVGYVDRPYTTADLEATLAEVSGDAPFASDFFGRYIRGHEVIGYERLLDRAGLLLRRRAPGQAFAGDLRMQDAQDGLRIIAPVPGGSPAYAAGLERDDLLVSIGGVTLVTVADFDRAIRSRRPGDTVPVIFERRGLRTASTMRLVEDPHLEVVLAEEAGQLVTAERRRFRDGWLNSGGRN